jgi:hypothetical protein
MSDDGRSFTHISYHIADAWRVHTATYPDTTPIFGIDAGPSFISITTMGRVADQAAVEFARALASEARKFADEMERMHAAQLADADGDTKAAGSDAA